MRIPKRFPIVCRNALEDTLPVCLGALLLLGACLPAAAAGIWSYSAVWGSWAITIPPARLISFKPSVKPILEASLSLGQNWNVFYFFEILSSYCKTISICMGYGSY